MSPVETAAEMDEPLQSHLDRAAKAQWDARSERNLNGCVGTLCILTSVLLILFAILIAAVSLTLGLICGVIGAAGTLRSIRSFFKPAQSQADADRLIVAFSERLSGAENLRLSVDDRKEIHKRLYEAQPEQAIAILKALAVAGDRESLELAHTLARHPVGDIGIEADADRFAAGRNAEVNRVAAITEQRIRDRLELARRSETLLRPAAATASDELLRPVEQRSGADPQQLLRASGGVGPDSGETA